MERYWSFVAMCFGRREDRYIRRMLDSRKHGIRELRKPKGGIKLRWINGSTESLKGGDTVIRI